MSRSSSTSAWTYPFLNLVGVPARLGPLLAQDDFARERLTRRMIGPACESGTGTLIDVPGMTGSELL